MKSLYPVLLLFVLGTTTVFPQIYVAPDGDDTNPGTIIQPLESIQQVQAFASPGDTVFRRGGLYQVREDQTSQVEQNLFACISFLIKTDWGYAVVLVSSLTAVTFIYFLQFTNFYTFLQVQILHLPACRHEPLLRADTSPLILLSISNL